MIRFTEKGQEGRHERLEALRKRLKAIRRLNSYKDSEDWKELKGVLEDFIESEKNGEKVSVVACAMGGYYDPIDRNIRKETDSRLVSDIRVAYERQTAFQLVIDLVEKTDEQIDHITGTIKDIEKTFKEAKEQIA